VFARGKLHAFRVINMFCVFMRKCCFTLKFEMLFVHLEDCLYQKP
jgi:hypothetical protein